MPFLPSSMNTVITVRFQWSQSRTQRVLHSPAALRL